MSADHTTTCGAVTQLAAPDGSPGWQVRVLAVVTTAAPRTGPPSAQVMATAPVDDPEAQHGGDAQRTDEQGLPEHVPRHLQGVEVAHHPDREQQQEPGEHRA